MTKKIKNNKISKLNTIIKIVLVVLAMIFSWVIYSLFRFDGIYSPIYIWGISNPYKYYQEHIGLQLIENGKPYDLKLSIDENNPKTYKVYENKEHTFRFKYSRDFEMSINEKYYNRDMGVLVEFFKNDDIHKRCIADVRYKGWGVGINSLPKKRHSFKGRPGSSTKLLYFYTKNRQIAYIKSTAISKMENVGKFTGTMYIDKKNGNVTNLTIYGENCLTDLAMDVLTTFEFIK